MEWQRPRCQLIINRQGGQSSGSWQHVGMPEQPVDAVTLDEAGRIPGVSSIDGATTWAMAEPVTMGEDAALLSTLVLAAQGAGRADPRNARNPAQRRGYLSC
jgi:hypothetical protein